MKLSLTFAVLLLSTTFSACNSTSSKSGAHAMPSEQEMMEKWQAFATPAEGHKVLKDMPGTWKGKVTQWMAPGAPPVESECTTETKWILDGRYLQDTTRGNVMGMPFEGHGTTGYDNLLKKYVFTWVDNMGTGIMNGEGTWDARSKSVSFKTTVPDPTAGEYVSGGMKNTLTDANHWKMEMWAAGPDGKQFKCMEIAYTRVN